MRQALEVARLRRALALTAEPIPGGYRITGGSQPRDVLVTNGQATCCCEDALFHPGQPCKHELAAILRLRLGAALFNAVRVAVNRADR